MDGEKGENWKKYTNIEEKETSNALWRCSLMMNGDTCMSLFFLEEQHM